MKRKKSQKVEGKNSSDCSTAGLEIHSFESLSFGLSKESRIEKSVVRVSMEYTLQQQGITDHLLQ
ncbi:MAG: hypothetical protein ACRD5B_09680 [Nitrososphaeraceae archaeon]